MSSIYKLSIQGIRSFDSNDRETIEFGTPLTLIVGMNGSGKTTIIECLKYATTGDLPPNSKGGVFVHDPKITGEKDIRAQVKLAFTSANGLSMIVTRNIQLLAKKTTNTFKTLEGQLVAINKSGERTTLSTRSLELDTQVPLYMGVPKAILEYVIFCHQEDSLWPLSEPSNLKKKFDEIFQAMKFTKALDNLKTIKKDMAVDIKLLKQSVEHFKLDRDRSKVTKMNIYQLEAKIEQYQQDVKKIESELNEVTDKSDKLFKSNQDFQEVLSKVDNLRTLKTFTEDERDRLSRAIELINLPKTELLELMINFSKTLDEKESEIKQTQDKIDSWRTELKSLQDRLNDLMRKQGEFKAKEANFHKHQKTISGLTTEFVHTYGLGDDDITEKECLRIIDKFKSNMQDDIDSFVGENNNVLKGIETKLKDVTYSETVQAQKLNYNELDKQKLLNDISNLEIQYKDTTFTDKDLIQEKEALLKFETNLKDMDQNNEMDSYKSKIKEKNDKTMIIENEIEEVQERIGKTNQQADLFAKLGMIKDSIKQKKSSHSELVDKLTSDEKINEWNLSINNDIDMDFKRFYIDLQKRIAISNKDFHENENKFNESMFHQKSIEKELKDHQTNISNITKVLNESLPDDCPLNEYNEVIDEAELSYKTALENLKMHQTTLDFNRKALEVAEKNDCCYLCSRKFETTEFRSKLLQELKSKTDEKFEATLKEAVNEEKIYLNELRALEKDVIKLNSIKGQQMELITRFEMLKQESHGFKEELDNSEKINRYLKYDKDHAESVLRPLIEKMLYLKKELKDMDMDSKSISEELKIYGNSDGTVQTVGELQDEQRKKNENMRQLRKEINELQNDRESKTRQYTNILNIVKEKALVIEAIERSLEKQGNLEKDISTRKQEIGKLDENVDILKCELKSLVESKKNLQKNLDDTRLHFDKALDEKRALLQTLEKKVSYFSDLLADIERYEKEETSSLSNCSDEILHTEKELKETDVLINKELENLNIQKQKVNDSNNEKRNLGDNIELIDMKTKLEDINRQISNLDIQNAEAERSKYQEESSRLRGLYEKLSSENAGKLGEMKQLQNQIDSLQRQLRSDYKGIDDKYHKEWVELQTRTFVTDDIDTYSKALDNAIMRYHGLKMEDINKIIDELWKRTYSGTDIDTIKIRSDEVTTTTRGKSYNYRVVMFKQDAELDMRGRCSAGQKVLASIIIRLALSETFGINCGVIALDEPTTNLDEENIESLAKSLSNIIHMRQHQKNFQLIVITHDEKFLNHMSASEFTDHFFKVKRDDRQKSQIEWVDINRVTE